MWKWIYPLFIRYKHIHAAMWWLTGRGTQINVLPQKAARSALQVEGSLECVISRIEKETHGK